MLANAKSYIATVSRQAELAEAVGGDSGVTYICIECRKTFDTLAAAQRHPYRRVSKDSPVEVHMRRHIVVELTGGGWRTRGSIEPEGQTAVPFRECGTPPTVSYTQVSPEDCTYGGTLPAPLEGP
jgi:hypothetical protein